MGGEGGLHSVPRVALEMPTVLVLAVSLHQRVRFVDALRGRARLEFVQSFQQLSETLRATTKSVDVVILPSHDADGNDAVRTIREIALERPQVAIIGYCRAGSQYSTDIRALAAAGVHQFVFVGIDDTGVAFRAVLDMARRQCAAECVMDALAGVVPAALHPILEVALGKPQSVTTVPALAKALGVHRKTLFNRCERANFIPPAELLIWARLALVAYLLQTTGCTIETIAIELSFASDTALRNVMKRYTGQRASDVRRNGGLQCVIDALAQRLRRRHETRRLLHLV